MEAQLQKQKTEGGEVRKPNLTGIPTQMKLDFERRSGLSFDDVRVHYNSDKPARLGALAYTQGTQIHVGPGQERSLPHELGHVIQQKAGRVRPTRWVGGLPVNDQPELEREADLAPVQCMPAPGLWGVVQMELPAMPAQRGPNCGYHALSRALLKFQPSGTVNLSYGYDENNLEIYLTSYAIQNGFSLLGEAFDPWALAQVGNEFCRKNGIGARCSVLPFQDEAALTDILNQSAANDSVILIPYFRTGDFKPAVNEKGEKRAHWSAIETTAEDDSHQHFLYEGNVHGSIRSDGSQAGPLPVTPGDLFRSNQSIQSEYDWSEFIYPLGIRAFIRDPQANQAIRRYLGDRFNKVNNPELYGILTGASWKAILSEHYPDLYGDILSAGMGGMSEKQKFFDQGLAGFEDFQDFLTKLENTVNQTNAIEERHTAAPPSEAGPSSAPAPSAASGPLPLAFSRKGVQGVSLKGYVVEVKRTT